MTSQEPDTSVTSSQTWLHGLTRYHQQIAFGLFAATILLGLIPAWLFIAHRDDYTWIAIAATLLPLTTFVGGVWQKLRPGGGISDVDKTRLLVIAVGGILGLDLVILSFSVLIQWWSSIAGGLEA